MEKIGTLFYKSQFFDRRCTYVLGNEISAICIPYKSLKPWHWFKSKEERERIRLQQTLEYLDTHYRVLHGEVVHSYIHSGFASFRNSDKSGKNLVVVRCLIPEGTPYWKTGETYASFKVKLIEEIK
jgi:hypothetical protein